QFESEVSPSGLAFLADHQVFGTAIMPAAAFVEMGLAAAAKVFGSDERVLRDLVIGQALAFRDGAPRTVQLVVEPESDGAARFQVSSLGDDEETWVTHVSGSIGRLSSDERVRSPEPLDAVRARCSERISADAHYAGLQARGLAFGPSLRGVGEIWRRDGEALGQVHLPEAQAAEAATYQLHPALLDACLQILAAALPQVSGTYLPIGIERCRLHARAATEVW